MLHARCCLTVRAAEPRRCAVVCARALSDVFALLSAAVCVQGTLWDAPSPLRVPAPSARLYTGTKHTRKWASATAPNTRHVATSPELRGTARRLPSTPSDRELRRRAKQDYRSQQGLDSPSGRRSATFGRNTPTVDDGDDVAPAANLVRFADATGDAHASDDAPAASPAAGATEQSSKVTGTAVTATETRLVQTTTVESSTTVARTTVMHSHNEAGSMVTTRTATTNSAAPNFVVDERPPQKHTWYVPPATTLRCLADVDRGQRWCSVHVPPGSCQPKTT